MSYKEKVREAKGLVKRSEADQWRLAELTHEVLTSKAATATKWAEDIGVHRSTATKWAEAYARYARVRSSARPLFADALREERPDMPIVRAKSAVRVLPAKEKAALAAELLEDVVADDFKAAAVIAEGVLERVARTAPNRPFQKAKPPSLESHLLGELTSIAVRLGDVADAREDGFRGPRWDRAIVAVENALARLRVEERPAGLRRVK